MTSGRFFTSVQTADAPWLADAVCLLGIWHAVLETDMSPGTDMLSSFNRTAIYDMILLSDLLRLNAFIWSLPARTILS